MVCDRPLTLALLLAVILFTTISPVSASDSPGSNPVSAADSYSAQGTLNIVYGDGPEGFSKVKYYLYGDDGTRIRLSFASPPSFAYFGKQVLVTGAPPARALVQTGQAETTMYVESISLLSRQGAQANAGAMLGTVSGTKKMIILLLRYSDDLSVPHDPTFYFDLINSPVGSSVNAFYQADSWGRLSIYADTTTGWLTLPHPKSYYAPCGWSSACLDWDALSNDGIALADSQVNFANYDMISFVASNDFDCCAWGGGWYDTLDGVTKTWGATWMPPWSQELGTYSHEVGHSIGLPHSGWVYQDYDSPWDVMSGGDNYDGAVCGSYYSRNNGGTTWLWCYTPGDMIAAYKDMLGWIDPSHLLTVPLGGSALASVDSLAAPLDISYKMLKICIPGYSCVSGGETSRYLTVEARTHYGYDSYLPGEGVILHMFQGDRPLVSGPCFFISDNPPAYPIDSTPGDYIPCIGGLALSNAEWHAGQSYSDMFTLGPGRYLTVTSQVGSSPSPIVFSITITRTSLQVSSVPADVLDAAANSVIYVLPDWQGGDGHAKPPDVIPAQLSDFTALGFMFGASNNTQVMALDTNSTYFDAATGAPKMSNSVLVAFAGPLVNGLVKYYEVNGTSPVYFQWATIDGASYYAWYDRQSNMVASLPSSAGQAGTSDMFLVEYFKDANNNNVFIIYGFAWKGTYIGGVFFKTYILPNIASFTHGWYIYQWNDVNGNGLPDPYEVNMTPVSYGD
jgi:M6 family metalloprotease-like protein